jgi:hypothetical protein
MECLDVLQRLGNIRFFGAGYEQHQHKDEFDKMCAKAKAKTAEGGA